MLVQCPIQPPMGEDPRTISCIGRLCSSPELSPVPIQCHRREVVGEYAGSGIPIPGPGRREQDQEEPIESCNSAFGRNNCNSLPGSISGNREVACKTRAGRGYKPPPADTVA